MPAAGGRQSPVPLQGWVAQFAASATISRELGLPGSLACRGLLATLNQVGSWRCCALLWQMVAASLEAVPGGDCVARTTAYATGRVPASQDEHVVMRLD